MTKLICIEKYWKSEVFDINLLIIGEEYYTTDSNFEFIAIYKRIDGICLGYYLRLNFITIAEFREQRINSILE